METRYIMNTLHFNNVDFKANREGHLSDAQMKRFSTEADRLQGEQTYSGLSGIIVLFVAVIVLLIFAYIINALVFVSAISFFYAIEMLIFFIFAVFFVINMAGYGLKIRSLRNTSVRVAEGRAKVVIAYISRRNGDKTINRLILYRTWYSRSTFNFNEDGSIRYFENDNYYRVYYLPGLNPQALSAEEFEPEKAKR